MKCPFCSGLEDSVIDSREHSDGSFIRRRRVCSNCEHRYTTYERIEEISLMVIKKDGRRERFEPRKIIAGLTTACEKRPIDESKIQSIANSIERAVQDSQSREIATSQIGKMIMKSLKALDQIAYVRFASVYLEFKDVTDFMTELKRVYKP